MKVITGYREIRSRREISHLICDICLREDKLWHPNNFSDYDISETIIKMKEDTRHPNGGEIVETEFHVCPTCFKNALTSFIEAHGHKATTNTIDY